MCLLSLHEDAVSHYSAWYKLKPYTNLCIKISRNVWPRATYTYAHKVATLDANLAINDHL